jgi:hypothetical protein
MCRTPAQVVELHLYTRPDMCPEYLPWMYVLTHDEVEAREQR